MRMMHSIRAWYRGAEPSKDRGSINAPAKHAYEDLTKRDRIKLMEVTRELERNDGVLNGILDLIERYAIGANGISIIPDTSDPAYNAAARRAYEDWQPHGDIGSDASWGANQRLLSRLWAMDGDPFILLTEEADRSGRTRPRYQLIESHRCQTPPDKAHLEGIRIFDGVEVDAIGRKVAVWIQTSDYKEGAGKSQHSRERKYVRIPSRYIVQLFDRGRVQQYRGMSMFYPVLNDLRDLREWHNLEMLATKDAAETGKLINTESGEEEINPAQTLVRGAAAADSDGDWSEEELNRFRETFGAKSWYMKNGENVRMLQHTRPADSTQRFWDRIVDRIMAGVGIPRELLFPAHLRGPLVHAVFDMGNSYFRSLTPMFVEHFARVYHHVLAYENQTNPAMRNPPPDWRRYKYIPPRAINTNIGRNSAALVNEWKAGWRTDEEIAAMDNRDWREVTEQKAREAAYKREMLEKYPGISMADLSQINPNESREPEPVAPIDPEDNANE